MKRFALFVLLAGLAMPAVARADAPYSKEVTFESAEDARAREVAQKLRCAVCQNESVADSGSQLAAGMRELIHEQISQGMTNDQIIAHFRSKYGDYILMEPRKAGSNLILWAFPFLFLIVGVVVIALRLRNREQTQLEAAAPAEIDPAELIQALRQDVKKNSEKS